MAEKALKRKHRPRAAPAEAQAARRLRAVEAARDPAGRQPEQTLGAHYSAGPAYGLAPDAPPPADPHADVEAETAEQHLRGAGPGEPLPASLRRRYEAALGHDLGAVRIHRGPAAEQATGDLQAHAFTHRSHIWLGARTHPADARLMAHELTHVIQQGHAPALPARLAVKMPGRAANSPVYAAPAGSRAAPSPGAGAVQRYDIWGAARRVGGAVVSGARVVGGAVASGARVVGGAVVSGARVVGGAVVEAAGDLMAMGRGALLAVVRRIAPEFLPLFEGDGIGSFIRRLIQRGLRSLFDGLLSPLQGMLNVGSLGARVSQAIGWISSIAGQLANNDCSGILAAARQVGAFFSSALGPVIARIRSISDQVSGFFRSIWEGVGAPIMEVLRRIGGEIWQSLRGFVADVGRTIRKVRAALGSAWQRVKGWFGIRAEEGEEEGGGLWGWIRDKATEIGRTISNTLRPVLGPLRQAGGALLILVPGGQIAAVMMLWPELSRAFSSLSQRWQDLNLIPRARAFLANTVLPALINAAESVAQAFLRGADWLLGLLDRVAGALAGAMRAATGMFAPLGRVIGYARQQFHRLVTWARGGLRFVSRNFRSLVRRLIRFLQPILDALRELVMIAVNPFGIVGFLAGTLWRALPECLKGPIIDFILEVIIRLLRAMPPMPQLGILWPLVKSSMLGFLEQVLSFSTPRKVNVANKTARIVSGRSPDFLIGYLRGLALGVWRGITAPFQAIAAIFELPGQIQAFLGSLGLRLCELVEQIRCFAATLVGRVFGSLDDVLGAMRELLDDPARILELIRCAIEGALGAAHSLGQAIAGQMMAILEGPDDGIGERMGEVTGQVLVHAVITYFTAGAGAGIGIIQSISRALSTVGRAIRQVIGVLRGLLGRVVGFVRGLASRFAGAVARGGRSVLGRLGGFFRRVAAWFGRLFARLGARLRRRFGLTAQERVLWLEFRGAVRGALAGHANGIRRGPLASMYRGVLRRFPRVAKQPAFITKHGPKWRLWVRRVKSIRPRIVGRVLLDPAVRWRQGRKAVNRAIRALKRRPGNIDSAQISGAIRSVRRQYHYTSLSAHFEPTRNLFVVDGAMSPGRTVTRTPPERPTRNNVQVVAPSSHVRIDPLVKRNATRSAPTGTPPGWNQVAPIKTRSGRTSLYIKGHIVSGYFSGGGTSNLTPITRSANARMASGAETPVKRDLPIIARSSSKRPIYKYDVRASGRASSAPPRRKMYVNNQWLCRQVPAERRLFRTITIRITKYGYNESSKQWDRELPSPSPGAIGNVPPYPAGYGEPC